MALAAGARLGPYEILEPLGAGGMGEVYRARDTRLGRDVAVKVLPAEVAGDPERVKRFEKEARTVASLSHPNILDLHDVGTHKGEFYLITELLEGQTLAQRLKTEALPLARALDYAQQVARGLATAHDKGIVHRDLKPGNLFLTNDGLVKILDFGLAKLRAPQTAEEIDSKVDTASAATAPGAVVGTVGYMSPEQVRGEPADHRSDIFSFGCVLYEMLAGERTFRGDSAADVAAAVLKEDPAPLAASVPPALDSIMRRCLEKRPEDRFQSAHDLALALRAIAGVAGPVHRAMRLPSPRALALTATAVLVLLAVAFVWKGIPALRNSSPRPGTPMTLAEQKPRIVVLPFENTSPEPDTEFYSDGITTEITDKLSKVGALTVLSHRTALALKGTPKPVPVIARELNLRYVLEGTIRRAGDSLRINARLVDGASEAILWSGQFPGTLDDVFDMQEKVARGIVDGLQLKLTTRESREVARRPITNAQAYDCYLRARNELIRFTPEGINAALQLLQTGRELSGESALLDAGLGYAYYQLGNIGIQQDEAFTKAEAYAEQALRLDPDTAEAHMVLGLVEQWSHGNWQKAVKHYREALRIDPNNVDTLFWLSLVYSFAGRTSAAMACADQLMQINPLDATPYAARMWAQYMDGRFDLSAESQRQLVGLLDVPLGRAILAYALAAAGRFEAALTELEPIGPVAGPDQIVRLAHLLKLALQGKKDEISELLSPEFVATSRRDSLSSIIVADCYAMLDEREPALEWLENAVSRGLINYPYLSEYDPFVAKLRSEPRFQKLMVRVKGEWQGFEE